MELSMGMNSGAITEKIRTEIRSIQRRLPEICGVFGFGSFFRAETHNDIDILFVVDCDRTSLLSTTKSIRAEAKNLSLALNQSIDPLILTKREFEEQPLRDMSELQDLAAYTSTAASSLPDQI